MAVSPAEYQTVLEVIREPNFRDLIELWWEAGSRPQELRKIEGRFFDIVARLVAERPEGALLLNSEGNPWKKDAITYAFCRLEQKVGKKYHLGAFSATPLAAVGISATSPGSTGSRAGTPGPTARSAPAGSPAG